MRDLVLSVVIPIALLYGLFSASGSVLVLNWIWFQRPYDFSWGLWHSLPLFQIAFGVAVVSNIVRGQLRPRMSMLLAIYLLLMCWVTLSAAFAFNSEHAWQFYRTYMPSMWMAPILMFATIHDLRMLKWVIWVAAGGIGLNGAKAGLSLTLGGGGHLAAFTSGFVGDNNVFGLVLCVVMAILIGLRSTVPQGRRWRWTFWLFVAAIALCIVYTRSRGAIVTLGAIFLLGSLLGSRPIRSMILVVVIAVAAYVALPPENFERLSTLSEYREDASAMGRIANWGLAWDAAVRHPILGVGPDNHILYAFEAGRPDVDVRVAHNVYLQVLGELGFPGLALYLAFVILGLYRLRATWRYAKEVAKANPDLTWVSDLSFWMLCGYVGYSLGASFLNMFYIEFPWYVVFYGSMLEPLLRKELAARKSGAAAEDPMRVGQFERKVVRRRAAERLMRL